jgi:High-temperature-induced dauer-formation protein
MISSPIYSPAGIPPSFSTFNPPLVDQLLRRPSPYTTYLISSHSKKAVLSHLCSLLNTAMKYNPAGWHLPYEHYLLSDPKKLLVTYSLQTLLVLLTHDLRPEDATPTGAPARNAYRFYVGKLHRTDDFQFLVDGINRLLSLPIQSNASVLPGSQRTTKAHSEAMVLFWEVWKCNKVPSPIPLY